MKFFVSFGVAVLIPFISGCATDFDDYAGATNRAAVANMCVKNGLINNDDFSHYVELQMGWGARQNMTIVDDQKMKSMYLANVENFNRQVITPAVKESLRVECANIAVVASRVRGQTSTPRNSAPAYTPPRTTNCITNYGYTTCTSY